MTPRETITPAPYEQTFATTSERDEWLARYHPDAKAQPTPPGWYLLPNGDGMGVFMRTVTIYPKKRKEPREGDAVVLTRPADRFPHFIAKAGSTGVVTEWTPDSVSVRMDEPLEGAEEWDNEVLWTPEDFYPGAQNDARAAAIRDVALVPKTRSRT